VSSKIASAKRTIDEALKADIRSDLRDQLHALGVKIDKLGPDPSDAMLSSALSELESVRVPIESSIEIAEQRRERTAFSLTGT
jgi:hypothetical protein